MKNVIIVHGGNDTATEAKKGKLENERHWQIWLKKELEKKGFEVSNKLYPENWAPNYEKWKNVFEKNKINKNSILVGHSDGASFLVRWLGENKEKINKLILISPWKVSYRKGEVDKDFYEFDIDNTIKERVGYTVIFTSNNDRTEVKEGLKTFYELLGGKVINLKNKGHFTLEDMKTNEFPELLEEILK